MKNFKMREEYYKHNCLCGCGEKIKVNRRHGKEKDHPIPKYTTGHHMRKREYQRTCFKDGNVPWNDGKKMPELSKMRMGENNPMFGKTHPSKGKSRSCISREKHPMWKGGISLDIYCEVWSDKEYKDSIKKRDGNRCLNSMCSNGNFLGVHHINYNKKDCHPKNLISLCRSCNTKANTDRDWHQSWYEAIIFRRSY